MQRRQPQPRNDWHALAENHQRAGAELAGADLSSRGGGGALSAQQLMKWGLVGKYSIRTLTNLINSSKHFENIDFIPFVCRLAGRNMSNIGGRQNKNQNKKYKN